MRRKLFLPYSPYRLASTYMAVQNLQVNTSSSLACVHGRHHQLITAVSCSAWKPPPNLSPSSTKDKTYLPSQIQEILFNLALGIWKVRHPNEGGGPRPSHIDMEGVHDSGPNGVSSSNWQLVPLSFLHCLSYAINQPSCLARSMHRHTSLPAAGSNWAPRKIQLGYSNHHPLQKPTRGKLILLTDGDGSRVTGHPARKVRFPFAGLLFPSCLRHHEPKGTWL